MIQHIFLKAFRRHSQARQRHKADIFACNFGRPPKALPKAPKAVRMPFEGLQGHVQGRSISLALRKTFRMAFRRPYGRLPWGLPKAFDGAFGVPYGINVFYCFRVDGLPKTLPKASLGPFEGVMKAFRRLP